MRPADQCPSMHDDAARLIDDDGPHYGACREPGSSYTQEHDDDDAEHSLPPVDGGRAAWGFLAACWAVEALVFGSSFSFGVFHDYYNTHAPFAGSGSIVVIGTTSMGIIYMGTPIVIALCRTYPHLSQWSTFLGLALASTSMAMSSFCTSIPQLILFQGIGFGVGGCFGYCPCVLYIDEWFVKRKGFAYGVVWSAAGFGGVILPVALEFLLQNIGFQITTRIWAAVLGVSSIPLAIFIKPRRRPNSAEINAKKPVTTRYFLSRVFLIHQAANIFQASGFFLPGIYLPTYARDMFNASDVLAALTIILVNIATTTGMVIQGYMTDKLTVTTCTIVSATGAALSVFVLWGFAQSLGMLYVFCVFFGLFAGSWTSIWPGIMREVAKRGEEEGYGFVDPAMVYGLLCVGRGAGNIISGPLSDVLVRAGLWKGVVSGGWGSGYGGLILFTGLASVGSGVSWGLKRFGFL